MIATMEQVSKLRLSRTFRAPRDRVFAAWTTPADIFKWFGPDTCQALAAELDLQPGGEYRFRLKTESLGEVELHGIFQEVKRPAKLVYTWNWNGPPTLAAGESLVTVDFLDRGGTTEVLITHDQLPSGEAKDNHEYGWNGSLDKLEQLLASRPEPQHSGMPVGEFSWNELLTSDENAAMKFYSQVFGWQTADFPGAGTKYTLFKQHGRDVAGLLQRPGDQCPPHWMGYVTVASVDDTVKRVGDAGGQVILSPIDVPTVGRIAIFQDPQGAALGIFQPLQKTGAAARNQVVWCDIPVVDLDRAIRFYSAVLGAPIKKEQMGNMSFATLPHHDHEVSGCLTPGGCEGNDNKPSATGPLLYFNCQGRLDEAIGAIVPHGGKVLTPKHQIGPYGFRAVVLDSEGNRIALHSM